MPRPFAAPWLALLALPLAVPAVRAQEVAIVDVQVVDVERGRIDAHRTILVRGGRITWVGPAAKAPVATGATLIQGHGRFAIPGLWDMHVHIDDGGHWMLPLMLRMGVTGARDMGGTPGLVATWRTGRAQFPVPRLVIAGPIVTGVVPDSDVRVVPVPDFASGVAVVNQLAASGADFIKVHDWLSPEAYRGVLAGAQRNHLAVAGHLPVAIGAVAAARAGQRSIEHLGNARGGFLVDCQPDAAEWRERLWSYRGTPFTASSLLGGMADSLLGRLLRGCTPARMARLAADLGRTRVWVAPLMLSTFRLGLLGPPQGVVDDSTLHWLPVPLDSTAAAVRSGQRAPDGPRQALMHALYARYQAMVQALSRAGVPLLAGTDVLTYPMLLPGTSLHQELEELVAAGLSPAAALRSATLEPARYLEASDSLGTIAPGRVADLVLLRHNPLTDIRHTRSIEGVMLRGVWLDCATLDSLALLARHAPASDQGINDR